MNEVIGGWGVEGVTTLQSGSPLHLGTAQNLTNSYGGGSRPSMLGPQKEIDGPAQKRLNEWFNVADFAQPPAFTYGNESRTDTTLRSHGIAGRVRLQFRGEIFNLFDRVQFGCQGQTFGTPQFGVVSSQQDLPGLVQFALRLKF